jgi:hypothetical protein
MAEITRITTPSLATQTPGNECQRTGIKAGEVLAPGDLVYLKAADGRLWKASGAAANAAAVVVGMVLIPAQVGEGTTYYFGVTVNYASGTLTPGALLYLSGTVAGGLADAASTGGTKPIAYVAQDGARIFLANDMWR